MAMKSPTDFFTYFIISRVFGFMDYHLTISGLYYLLICADGNVNEKNFCLGRKWL